MNSENIKIGTIFTLCNEQGENTEYELSSEINFLSTPIKITKESAIGKVIYGRKLGDVISYSCPLGIQIEVIIKIGNVILPEELINQKIMEYKTSTLKLSTSEIIVQRLEARKNKSQNIQTRVLFGSNVNIVTIENGKIIDRNTYTLVEKSTDSVKYQAVMYNSFLGKKIFRYPVGTVFEYFKNGQNIIYGIAKIDNIEITDEAIIKKAYLYGLTTLKNYHEKIITVKDGVVIFADMISSNILLQNSRRFYIGTSGIGKYPSDKVVLLGSELFKDLQGQNIGHVFTIDDIQYKIVRIRPISDEEIKYKEKLLSLSRIAIKEGMVISANTCIRKDNRQYTKSLSFYIGPYVTRKKNNGVIVDINSPLFKILQTKTINEAFVYNGKEYKINNIRDISQDEFDNVIAKGVKVEPEKVVLALRINRKLKRNISTKFYLTDQYIHWNQGYIISSSSALWPHLLGKERAFVFDYKGDTFRITGIRDITPTERVSSKLFKK